MNAVDSKVLTERDRALVTMRVEAWVALHVPPPPSVVAVAVDESSP
jgi:hypothetical protein